MRGQGQTTTLPLTDCSLRQHVDDFRRILDLDASENAFGGVVCAAGHVDLVGFSFGARVALAIAANLPSKVRRLVATGVPADRGATGRAILQAWSSALNQGNLEGFLWQTMADAHSPAFLSRHESKLAGWVASAAKANRAEAIAALVDQTHTDDMTDPWHTVALTRKAARMSLGPSHALFIAGGQDRLAPPEQVKALAAEGGWRCTVIEDAAHGIPIEQPRLWRQRVVDFLDESPSFAVLGYNTLYK